jgi:cobalt-zinc-cadmium efflux system membrane fusion protein
MSFSIMERVAGRRRRRRGWIWLIVMSCTVGACSDATPDPVEPASSPAAGLPPRALTMTRAEIEHAGIRWAQVSATTAADVVEVPGQLAPNEDQTARVSAPARARVMEVHVRMGDRVTRGQPLATLQSEQAIAARAEQVKAEADLNARRIAAQYADAALKRAERLLELKAASQQDVERARVEQEAAGAMRAQAQADVERARATLVQLGIDRESGDMILRAPLAGVVLSRDVVPGSIVEAGVALVTVTDPSTLWLDISATERLAPELRRGRRVTFSVAELPSTTFAAVVEDVGGALDAETRTLPVHALVRNPTGVLRPAMFATVSLTVGEPRTGVALPDIAIQLLEERPVVFLARPDDRGGARFERRDVEVGATMNGQVHVVRGLTAGDVIVTDGAFAVKAEFARSTEPPD